MIIDIEKYLIEKKEKYRVIASKHPQFSLSRCPCCGDNRKDKFYISCETGQWDCKLCLNKGNLNQLREFFSDKHIKLEGEYKLPANSVLKAYRVVDKIEIRSTVARLWGTRPDVIKYLSGRGIKEKTIKYFNLGINKHNRLSIPIFENGKVVDMISRKLPGDPTDTPKYLHDTGSQLSLLNRTVLEQKVKPKEVFITEGSIDAMTAFQEISENVVGNSGGCGYIGKDWTELFEGVSKIFIIYDTDEGGKKGATALANFLGLQRTVIINLPKDVNDLNDYFYKSKYTKDQLLEIIENQREAEPEEVVKHISEFGDELLENIKNGELKGVSTGIQALDNILGGYKKGHMLIVAALTSAGKTTWILNLVVALAYHGTGTYFTSLEMSPLAISKKLLQMSSDIKLSELEDASDLTLRKTENGIEKLGKFPIYLFDGCGLLTYEFIAEGIKSAVADYGISVAFVDYLQYFQLDGKNIPAEVGKLVNRIKQLAMELDITIILVSQLNRSGRSKQKTGLYIPSLTDLKDSSTLEQSADSVIFICRDNEAVTSDEQKKTVIKVAKNREGKTGYFSANYESETGVFSEETERDYLKEHESDEGILSKEEGDNIFK